MYSNGRCDFSLPARCRVAAIGSVGSICSVAFGSAAGASASACSEYNHSNQEEWERRVWFTVEIGFVENDSGLSEIARDREVGSISTSVGIIERALSQVDEYDYLVLLFQFSN